MLLHLVEFIFKGIRFIKMKYKIKSFLKIVIYFFYNLFITILLSPIILFIRIISPFLLICFGTIRSDRIGHFVFDSAEQVGRNLLNKKIKTVHCYCLSDRICNKEWKKLISTKLYIFYFVKFLLIANKYIPGSSKHTIESSKFGSIDFEGLYYKYDCSFAFKEKKNKIGEDFLRSLGWDKHENIICLNIRDDAFLNDFDKKVDWRYHDYRNSNSDHFVKSIKWLLKQKFKVVRIGNIAKKRINITHPDFLDYPFCSRKNELLDIWLPSICTSCISTGGGIDAIPQIFRKPILFINKVPLDEFNFFNNSAMAPKIYLWEKNKKSLSFDQCLKHSYNKSLDYKEAGITIKDLNELEILEVVKDYYTNKKEDENVINMNIKFLTIYFTWFKKTYGKNISVWKHQNSKLSSFWLKKYGKKFLGNSNDRRHN